MNRSPRLVIRTAVALLLFGAGTVGAAGLTRAAAASPAPINLAGQFSIAAGHCRVGQPPSGSYVQLQIDGLPVPNPSSACGLLGTLYTPLQPGSQGGLVTGGYQLDPAPTFDAAGDSLAGAIVKPVRYLTTELGLATTCADQEEHPTPTGACGVGQAGNAVPALSAEPPATGGCPAGAATWCLYGDLSALTTTWAGVPIQQLLGGSGSCVADSGCFDQGVVSGPALSPSATSCRPVQKLAACSLSGTFDPTTGDYTLDVRAVTPLGVLPVMDTHYVLTGTFVAGPPAAALPAVGPAGTGPAGSGSGSGSGTKGDDGGTGTSSGGTGVAGGASAGGSPGANEPVLAADTAQLLTGTLQLAATSCTAAGPVGSYLAVSNGTKVVQNTASTCENGTYTLLPPGTSGLALGQFSPDPNPTFDANGDSLAGTIIQPVSFDGHKLGLGTAGNDVQDEPTGPAIYPPPAALVEGTTLLVDLRSLDVTYNGPPGQSCASGFGQGCWEEGVRTAIGTFDPVTDDWTLDWQADQAFTGDSAGVTFHLEGHFMGQASIAPAGTGDGWLPAQYDVVGGTTQTSGPGGAGSHGGKGANGASGSSAAGSSGGGSGSAGLAGGGGGGGGGSHGDQVIAGVRLPVTHRWQAWMALLVGLVIVLSVGALVATALGWGPAGKRSRSRGKASA